VKSSQAVSNPQVKSDAGTPEATTAFISRAPSMCRRRPADCAASTTPRSCASGQTRPPAMFVDCSTDTSRERGE
jgi:hypothetical protein